MTIKDVAKHAGVSISTVSNALSGRKSVSEATRARVLDAAREMDYVPNINAQLMKSRKTNNIGLFLPYIDGLFYPRMIQAFYNACKNAGYAMFAHISEGYTSKQVLATILSCNIDAAILLNDRFADEDAALLRSRSGMPIIFLDREIEGKGMSSIVIDNEKGVKLALTYLKNTGHKHIAYMRGRDNYDGNRRYEAFVRGMDMFKLDLDESMVLNGLFDENVAYAAMRGLLSRKRPDAVMCANDDMGAGCARAIADAGLRVPGDISVFGFDDIGVAEACDPPLTTVRISFKDFGTLALSEISRFLKNPDADGTILTLDTSLIVRESVEMRFPAAAATR